MPTDIKIPEPLQRWFGFWFSSGSVAGSDYREFEHAYIQWLRKALPSGYTLKAYSNHYEFTGVVTYDAGDCKRFVYVSIPDVRFCLDKWATSILVRTMRTPTDWVGGRNNYCTIDRLVPTIVELAENHEES